jgi:hypothetical protein
MLLSPAVIAVVFLAALLHAGCNVVVRAGTDRQRETALLVSGTTVLAALILPFLPAAADRCLALSADFSRPEAAAAFARCANLGLAFGEGAGF